MPKRKPLGKPLFLSDELLTKLSEVTPQDILQAGIFWVSNALQWAKDLINAKPKTSETEKTEPLPTIPKTREPEEFEVIPQQPKEEEPLIEWDEALGVYIALVTIRGATGVIAEAGQPIATEFVFDAIETVVFTLQKRMVSLGMQLQSGAITLGEWQLAMMNEIKLLHTISAAVSRGGWLQMSSGDWGYVGNLIKKQYQFLNDFAADIFSGKFPIEGRRFLERIKLYARAGRSTVSQIKRRFYELTRGAVEERRILGVADHCENSAFRPGCIELAAEGWRPIGTLTPIGAATCLNNCRCKFEYKNAEGEVFT